MGSEEFAVGNTAARGYYRQPTICRDQVVFVAEDDLWTVSANGGVARRLTANLAECSHPALSPDGRWLAFTGREEGESELYLMPSAGGLARRATYLGANFFAFGWTPNSQAVLATSNARQPFSRLYHLWEVPLGSADSQGVADAALLSGKTQPPRPLHLGPATSLCYNPDGPGVVLCRHGLDPARWKRYRGGTTGHLWIDAQGTGVFQRLLELEGNFSRPLWVGERIYFLCDHQGIGNLYSCTPQGEDLRRHTDCGEFYARNCSSDGRRIIYHAGAELYLFDPGEDQVRHIPVEVPSPRTQQQRKFVSAGRFLESYDLHPEGHSLAVVSRGKPFHFALWEGAVSQHGHADGVRYQLARWMADGQRLVIVADATGEERLEIHHLDPLAEVDRLEELDLGRVLSLEPAPYGDQLVVTNHRFELILVDLSNRSCQVLDQSPYERIAGTAWSPDARWVAYSCQQSPHTAAIKLADVASGETYPVTDPVLHDVAPCFDPEGRYLYFLSYRQFDPVYDNLYFDLNFPWGVRPYVVTLSKELPSPFIPQPRAPGEKPKSPPLPPEEPSDQAGQDQAGQDQADPSGPAESAAKLSPAGDISQDHADNTDNGTKKNSSQDKGPQPIRIDLEGLTNRVLAFPVPDGRYVGIAAMRGKVFFLANPVEGRLGGSNHSSGVLEAYSFEDLEKETIASGVSGFRLSINRKSLVYQAGSRLRAIKAGEKADNASETPSRKSGWIDLRRVRLSVVPVAERRQMYAEAWRLQREHFWTADMSEVDWQRVFQRYFPLIDRVATRSEFSDLLWEMQGELGTSHAYESGGDYRPEPRYDQGFLAAEFLWDQQAAGYRITNIISGDPWHESGDSPLNRPGLNIQEGQLLLAIDGHRLTAEEPPEQWLVHRSETEVTLTVDQQPVPTPQEQPQDDRQPDTSQPDTSQLKPDQLKPDQLKPDQLKSDQQTGDNGKPAGVAGTARTVTVKCLRDERLARYRAWVEANRRWVHQTSNGRAGYVHIPDMSPRGYAEFHRYYQVEIDRAALLVDVRFNGGGHVSGLLLEKLLRRRIAWCLPRWGQPSPYPDESAAGVMVTVTNELAGSDGDIFSHSFKLLGLGPLVGTRTWGGVIGIWSRHSLVDGTTTTQPEFSFWFEDVGWQVENYGTQPDIEVTIAPHEYLQLAQSQAPQADPQLVKGLEVLLQRLEEQPPPQPDFGGRPSRALPPWPPATS